MKNKVYILSITAVFLSTLFIFQDAESKKVPFTFLNPKTITRYTQDRVIFQHIEHKPVPYVFDKVDNSLASLMIIKDKKIYFFMDGYDDPAQVEETRIRVAMANKRVLDMWENKIDSIPDYVVILDKGILVQKNINKEWVGKTYKDLYAKTRNAYLKKHIEIFLSLMINRKESGLVVKRKPVPQRIGDSGPKKYSITVSGKTLDETVYYAEDADGDGITETFTVRIADGFNWGYKSGPNLVCIINNTREDITRMIGRLTNLAFYGTPEEKKIIKKSLPKTEDITQLIDNNYQMDKDAESLLKKHNIDIKKDVEEMEKQSAPSGKK